MNTAACRMVMRMGRWGLPVLIGLLITGCSTPALQSARTDFYSGKFDAAEKELNATNTPPRDRVLIMMERGTIRQAMGDYTNSIKDFIQVSDELDQLQTYSVSKGGASMVINDNVQDFRGAYFERTLTHTFNAHNHFATANWDDAAVEARRIIKSLSPEVKGSYPDDAYSHYVAGFALEMIDDDSNAALEYKKASGLLPTLEIDGATGHILAKTMLSTSTNAPPAEVAVRPEEKSWPHELVCFVMSGRSPTGDEVYYNQWWSTDYQYAEIVCDGKTLGRSYPLADTGELAFTTQRIDAAFKAAKTVGRIALKEAIASSVESSSNDAAGDLTRLILIGLLEQPDVRRWETLPRWLQVARVPCPANLKEFDVLFKDANFIIFWIDFGRPLIRKTM
ncbi:MAG: hypothetical protein V2A34_08510, partial [Lentisphaerota bacterium]